MPTNSRPPLSPDDAFVFRLSTLARAAARRLLILHNIADADDIAQDVTPWCRAGIRSGGMEIITTDIAGFVRTMVIRRTLNVARAADRRDARAVVRVQHQADVQALTTAEALDVHAEREACIDLAVASHPLMCCRLLHMVREDDASCAALLLTPGITRQTVKEHLTTARRRLRTALVDDGVIALPVLRARPTYVMAEANEVHAQRPNPEADRQDLAA